MKNEIDHPCYVFKKGKFLKSWGYSPFGNSYFWTNKFSEAYVFDEMESDADHYSYQTGGKILNPYLMKIKGIPTE